MEDVEAVVGKADQDAAAVETIAGCRRGPQLPEGGFVALARNGGRHARVPTPSAAQEEAGGQCEAMVNAACARPG